MCKTTVASRWIVLLVTLALLIPLASCASHRCTSADPPTIRDLEGEVWVQKQGSEDWVQLNPDNPETKPEVGDSLRTGEDGNVTLLFFEGSVMEVEANSEIVIEELCFYADTGSTMVKLRQTIGRTINRVEQLIDPASEYIVVTPASAAVVRGTTFKLLVMADDYTEVFCEEGEVEFTAAGEMVLVEEGERFRAIPGEPPSDKIVIGAARSLSGPLSSIGDFAFGPIMELWVGEVNADGGIYVEEYGKKLPVELKIYDDTSDVGTMISLLTGTILAGGHDFVFPPVGRALLSAAAPICNHYGYILLGGEGGGSTSITADLWQYPYWFSVRNYSNHNQMEELFKLLDSWWETNHDPDTMDIYVIYTDDPTWREYRDEFAAEAANYPGQFNIVKEVAVPHDTTDVSAQVIEAKDTYDVDVLFSFTYPATTFQTVADAIQYNKNFNAIILGVGANYEFFYDNGMGGGFGAATEGVIALGAWNEGSTPAIGTANPTAADFAGAMIDTHGRTGMDWWGHIYYYAGLQCFQQAIEQAGTLDQSVIRDILASKHFTTVLGDTWFADAAGTHPIIVGGGLLAKECHAGQIGQWQSDIFEVIDLGSQNTATGIYPKPDW